jgi:NADPH-ferrihemoprotein reductase
MAFGLGNSNYKHYNAVIDHVVRRVDKLGAQALAPTGRADDFRGETEEHFLEWKENILAILKDTFDLEEHDPVYEPAIQVIANTTTNDTSISHGVPLEIATSRVAARTISAIHALQVKSSHELFKTTADRNCLHMEIDLSSVTGLKYKTGDHLGVWPINPDVEVAKLVRSLDLAQKLQIVVSVETLTGEAKVKVPELTTLSLRSLNLHQTKLRRTVCCLLARMRDHSPSLRASITSTLDASSSMRTIQREHGRLYHLHSSLRRSLLCDLDTTRFPHLR